MPLNIGEVAVNFVSNLDKVFKGIDDLQKKLNKVTTGKTTIKVQIDDAALSKLDKIEASATKLADLAEKFGQVVTRVFDMMDGRLGNTARQMKNTIGKSVDDLQQTATDGVTNFFSKLADSTKRISPLLLGQLLGLSVLIQKLVMSGFDIRALLPSIFKVADDGSNLLLSRMKEFMGVLFTLNVPKLLHLLAEGAQSALGLASATGILLGTLRAFTSLFLGFLSKKPEGSLARFTQLVAALNDGLVGLLAKTRIAVERLFFITSALTTISTTIIAIQTGLAGLSGALVPIVGLATTAIAGVRFLSAKVSRFLLGLRASLGDGRAATTLFLRALRQMFPIFEAVAKNAKPIAKMINQFAKGGFNKRVKDLITDFKEVVKTIKNLDANFRMLFKRLDDGFARMSRSLDDLTAKFAGLFSKVSAGGGDRAGPAAVVERTAKALRMAREEASKTNLDEMAGPRTAETGRRLGSSLIKAAKIASGMLATVALPGIGGLLGVALLGRPSDKAGAISLVESTFGVVFSLVSNFFRGITNLVGPQLSALFGDVTPGGIATRVSNIMSAAFTAITSADPVGFIGALITQGNTVLAAGIGAVLVPTAIRGVKNLTAAAITVAREEINKASLTIGGLFARTGGFTKFIFDKVKTGISDSLKELGQFLVKTVVRGERAAAPIIETILRVVSLGDEKFQAAIEKTAKRGSNLFVTAFKTGLAALGTVLVAPFSRRATVALLRTTVKGLGSLVGQSFTGAFTAAEFVTRGAKAMVDGLRVIGGKVKESDAFKFMFAEGPLAALTKVLTKGAGAISGLLSKALGGLGGVFGFLSGRGARGEESPEAREIRLQQELQQRKQLQSVQQSLSERAEVAEKLNVRLFQQLQQEERALNAATDKAMGLEKVANIISATTTDFNLALGGNTEFLMELQGAVKAYKDRLGTAVTRIDELNEQITQLNIRQGQLRSMLARGGQAALTREEEAELVANQDQLDILGAELAAELRGAKQSLDSAEEVRKLMTSAEKAYADGLIKFSKFDAGNIEQIQGELRKTPGSIRGLVVEFDDTIEALESMKAHLPPDANLDLFEKTISDLASRNEELNRRSETLRDSLGEVDGVTDALRKSITDVTEKYTVEGRTDLTNERRDLGRKIVENSKQFENATAEVLENANAMGANNRIMGTMRSRMQDLLNMFGITSDELTDTDAVFEKLNEVIVRNTQQEVIRTAQREAMTKKLLGAEAAEVQAIIDRAAEEAATIRTVKDVRVAQEKASAMREKQLNIMSAFNAIQEGELRITKELQNELGLTDQQAEVFKKSLADGSIKMGTLGASIAALEADLKFTQQRVREDIAGAAAGKVSAARIVDPATSSAMDVNAKAVIESLGEQAQVIDASVLTTKEYNAEVRKTAASLKGAVAETTAKATAGIEGGDLRKLLAVIVAAGKGRESLAQIFRDVSGSARNLRNSPIVKFADEIKKGAEPLEAFRLSIAKIGRGAPQQLEALESGLKKFFRELSRNPVFAQKVLKEFSVKTVQELAKVTEGLNNIGRALKNQLIKDITKLPAEMRTKAKRIATEGILEGIRSGLDPKQIRALVQQRLKEGLPTKDVKLRADFAASVRGVLDSISQTIGAQQQTFVQKGLMTMQLVAKGIRAGKPDIQAAVTDVFKTGVKDQTPSSLPKFGPLREAILSMAKMGPLMGESMMRGVGALRQFAANFFRGGVTDVWQDSFKVLEGTVKGFGNLVAGTFTAVAKQGESLVQVPFKIAGAFSLVLGPRIGGALNALLKLLGKFTAKVVTIPLKIAAAVSKAVAGVITGAISLIRSATTSIFNFVKDAAARITELKRQAVTAEVDLADFDRITRAFEMLGVQASQTQQAFIQLRSSVDRMIEEGGVGDLSLIFSKMGVTFDRLQELSPDEIFFRIVEALRAGVFTATEQQRVLQLIGAQFGDLKGVILDATTDINSALRSAAKIPPIGDEAVENAKLFQKITVQIEQVFERIKLVIFEELAPFLENLFKEIDSDGNDLIGKIIVWVRFIARVVFGTIAEIVRFIRMRWFEATNGVSNFIQDVSAVATGLMTFLTQALFALIRSGFKLLLLTIELAIEAMPSKLKAAIPKLLLEVILFKIRLLAVAGAAVKEFATFAWSQIRGVGIGVINWILNTVQTGFVELIKFVIDKVDVIPFVDAAEELVGTPDKIDIGKDLGFETVSFEQFLSNASNAIDKTNGMLDGLTDNFGDFVDQLVARGDVERALESMGGDAELLRRQFDDLFISNERITAQLEKQNDLIDRNVLLSSQQKVIEKGLLAARATSLRELDSATASAVELQQALRNAVALGFIKPGDIAAGQAEAVQGIIGEMAVVADRLGQDIGQSLINGLRAAEDASPAFADLFTNIENVIAEQVIRREQEMANLGASTEEVREAAHEVVREFIEMRVKLENLIPAFIAVQTQQLEFNQGIVDITGKIDRLGRVMHDIEKERLQVLTQIVKREQEEAGLLKTRIDLIFQAAEAEKTNLASASAQKAAFDIDKALQDRAESLKNARNALFVGDAESAKKFAEQAQMATDAFNDALQTLAPRAAEHLKLENPLPEVLFTWLENLDVTQPVIKKAEEIRNLMSEGLSDLGAEALESAMSRGEIAARFAEFKQRIEATIGEGDAESLRIAGETVGLLDRQLQTRENILDRVNTLKIVAQARAAAEREITREESKRERARARGAVEPTTDFDVSGARDFRNEVLSIRKILNDAALSADELKKALKEEGVDVDFGVDLDNIEGLVERVKEALKDREIEILVRPFVDEKISAPVASSVGEIFSGAIDGSLKESIRTAREEARKQGRDIQDWIFVTAQFAKRIFDQVLGDVTTSFVKGLQENLTSALSKVLGTTSALAVQGALLIGSAVLSKLQENATVVQDTVESAVESTEAIRGVISGTTTVAIKEVEEAFRASNRGIELRLDVIIDLMRQGRPLAAGAGLGNAPATAIP